MSRIAKPSLQRQQVGRRTAQVARDGVGRLRQLLRRRGLSLLAAGVLLLLVHDLFGEHGLLAVRRSQKEAERLEQEITALNEENQRLSGEIEALKSDPATIERIARDEMGLAKPGEFIFTLPPKPQPPETHRPE
jgi:cell division protein FtsB